MQHSKVKEILQDIKVLKRSRFILKYLWIVSVYSDDTFAIDKQFIPNYDSAKNPVEIIGESVTECMNKYYDYITG